MRNIVGILVLLVGLMAYVSPTDAFFAEGEIDENYSYENLEIVIKGKKKRKCYLKGTIINETGERKENGLITFYALNIHNETLWKVPVKISLISRNGKFDFEEQIKRVSLKKCKAQEPHKWKFKVKKPKERVVIVSSNTFSRGLINKTYSYENLVFVRTKKGKKNKCHLRGTIVNDTNERKEDVKITFYAKTMDDKTLWKAAVRMDIIDRYGKFDFEKSLKRCMKGDVFKWEFKVKE